MLTYHGYIYIYLILFVYICTTKKHKNTPPVRSSSCQIPGNIRKIESDPTFVFFVFRQRAGRLGPALSREAYSAHQSGALEPPGKNVDDTSPPENLDAWKRIPVFLLGIPFSLFCRMKCEGCRIFGSEPL